MTRGKSPDVNNSPYFSIFVSFSAFLFISFLSPSQRSVSRQHSLHSLDIGLDVLNQFLALLLKIRSAPVSLIDNVVAVSLVPVLGLCPVA